MSGAPEVRAAEAGPSADRAPIGSGAPIPWWRRRPRALLAGGFLLLQAAGIVHARFVDTRYFCWAPHDTQTEYWLEVVVAGRRLTDEELRARYRLEPHGWNSHAAANVIDVLRRTEEAYGRGEPIEIVLRYRRNGRPERTWRWER